MEITLKAKLPDGTFNGEPIKLDSPKFAIGEKVYYKSSDIYPQDCKEGYVIGISIEWSASPGMSTYHRAQPFWIYHVAEKLNAWGSEQLTRGKLWNETEWLEECKKYPEYYIA